MKNVILYEKGDKVFIYDNNVHDDKFCGLTEVVETPELSEYNFQKDEVFLKTELNHFGMWVKCRLATLINKE